MVEPKGREDPAVTDGVPPGRRGRAAGVARRLASGLRPSGEILRIVAVWAVWLAVICTFQVVAEARLQPARPDNVLAWTHYATDTATLDCRARLNDPFFNEHVKYDSEYYISIAVAGYNDPEAQAYYPNSAQGNSGIPVCRQGSDAWVSLNYAFMPGYPMAMDAVMAVEGVLPVLRARLRTGRRPWPGIIVSALGGLLAMLALCRLMAVLARRRKSPDSEDSASTGRWGGVSGLRAAFYLLIFPTGFYLAQVYTEGLFIGLAFMACAMAVERKMLFAAGLAVLATLVRPTGICLIFPLAWAAFEVLREPEARAHWRRTAARVAAPLAPVVPFVVWWFSVLGQNWRAVEDGFFGRKFDPIASLGMWGNVIDSFVSGFDKTATGLYGYGIYTGTPPGPLPSSSTVYIGLELHRPRPGRRGLRLADPPHAGSGAVRLRGHRHERRQLVGPGHGSLHDRGAGDLPDAGLVRPATGLRPRLGSGKHARDGLARHPLHLWVLGVVADPVPPERAGACRSDTPPSCPHMAGSPPPCGHPPR